MLNWRLKHYTQLTLNELYVAMRLRQEVFVVEQNCPFVDADNKDQHCHHLFGFLDTELAAYARIVPPGIAYAECSIGRVVTAPKYRRNKYGRQLMDKSIEAVEQLFGKVPIRIGAQLYLKNFYADFGFVPEGEPYLEDDILHVIMVRPTVK